MEHAQVSNPGTITLPQLISVTKTIFKQFHNGNDTAGCVFDFFDGVVFGTKIGQVDADASADAGQLQCTVDTATNAVHVIFQGYLITACQFTAAFSTGVHESRGCGLEPLGNHFLRQLQSECFFAFS